MNTRITTLVAGALLTALVTGGCRQTLNPVHLTFDDATPPSDRDIDLHTIADAVPTPEPLSPIGNPRFYEHNGQRFIVLPHAAGYSEQGLATVYPTVNHGKRTANGEIYDMFQPTAGHRTLPLPSFVRVTNPTQGRSITVRVNDRGPANTRRLIRLSYVAAAKLGIPHAGKPVNVIVTAIDPGPPVNTQRVLPSLPTGAAVTPPIQATLPAAAPADAPASPVQPIAPAQPSTEARRDAGIIYGVPRDRGFLVQLGAFSIARNADNLADRLQRAGFAPIYLAVGVSGGKPIQRVQIGPFASYADAQHAARAAQRRGFNAVHIVTP